MYVIILAKTPQEGSTYAKRARLPKGGYRVATRASAIKGLRVAEIHELPSFRLRVDRHAIDAALRYTRGKRLQVEMPEVDLRIHDIDEAQEAAYLEYADRNAAARAAEAAEAFVNALTVDKEAARGEEAGATEPSEDAAPAPKAKPTAPRRKAKQSAATPTQGFF